MPKAFYRVSYRIELIREARTFVETLIQPCAVEMATFVLGEQSKKDLETVQLSNNTAKRHIQDLSSDTKKQLVSQLVSSFAFS
jgi:galactokinase